MRQFIAGFLCALWVVVLMAATNSQIDPNLRIWLPRPLSDGGLELIQGGRYDHPRGFGASGSLGADYYLFNESKLPSEVAGEIESGSYAVFIGTGPTGVPELQRMDGLIAYSIAVTDEPSVADGWIDPATPTPVFINNATGTPIFTRLDLRVDELWSG